jgi:trimeric autotransporter adhesin
LLQTQNGLVGIKGNSAGGSAIFIGTTYASHFNYSTTEDTYIRGGKATSNLILSDVGNAVIVGNVPSLPAGYKLFVERGILTEKVKVALKTSANWSDYVFDKKYKLLPLAQVEQFINKNKHLPGIPSAQQLVNEGGVDVSSMLAKQMEKIEELTLHLISMNKQLSQLQQENKTQQQEIQSLKKK